MGPLGEDVQFSWAQSYKFDEMCNFWIATDEKFFNNKTTKYSFVSILIR